MFFLKGALWLKIRKFENDDIENSGLSDHAESLHYTTKMEIFRGFSIYLENVLWY